jgi:signal peptidase I
MTVAVVCAAAAAAAFVGLRRRYVLITVDGPSMRPSLAEGDRLLVRRGGRGRLRRGQLVVARRPWPGHRWSDPQPGVVTEGGWLVKRVEAVDEPPGTVYLVGDNGAQSWDSRQWGPCPTGSVLGVVVRVFR